MILLWIVVLIVILIVQYKVADEFYYVAIKKGYDEKKYFWYCFWLGIVGYLLVIALPDNTNTENVVNDELPEI